jgi:hypothetical protein
MERVSPLTDAVRRPYGMKKARDMKKSMMAYVLIAGNDND